jgi:hypothetical protein
MDDSNVFANLMVTATVLLAVILLPFLTLSLFPAKPESIQQTYSVIYNKTHPSGAFVFA